MRFVLWVCSFILLLSPLYAQMRLDTARAIVGDVAVLSLFSTERTIFTGDTLRISALLRLQNPSVWYPESLQTPTGFQTLGQTLVRENDSTWNLQYSARLTGSTQDTLLSIRGKTLAGYDSLCIITLEKLLLQGKPLKPVQGLIVSRTLAVPRLFIRFADLLPSVPHPSIRTETLRWTYRIDQTSEITFRIYDLTGKQVAVYQEGIKTPGTHYFSLNPGKWIEQFTATVYWIRLQTNTGEAIQRFWISE